MKFKVKTLFLSLIGLAVMFGISVNANASSTTLLNLEFPSSNSATTSLTIGGWAMSLEENTRIRIYFNGEELNDITRSSRADVLNAVKGYGDATTNPNPGFKTELNLAPYKDGKYSLVVQVVNENNQVLEEVAKTITVSKYVSLMTVEEPSSSVVGTNLTVGGWVMSTNKDALVQVLLDGVEIEGVNRSTRADVIKAVTGYGNAATNPTPGFKVTYDVSAFTDGKHSLEVRLYDPNSNEIMTQYKTTITLEKYKYKINLESPASTSISGTDLKIGGWLMASSPSITVKAYIDDEELSDFTRIKRADVLKAITGYGDATVNPTPGFEQTADLSSLDDGSHILKVEVINNDTNEVLEKISKNIVLEKYRSLLNVEEPANSSITGNSLTVSGWLMSVNKNAKVLVLLDGEEVGEVTRSARADVIKVVTGYGDAATNPTPGFKAKLDLSAVTDGKHTLTVRVVDATTNATMLEESKTITLTKYKTKLTLEEPLDKNITTSLKVTGWAMSTDPNLSIKVFVDDMEFENVKRTSRNDVLNAITGYGNAATNPNPGFETIIDMAMIKDGTHTVTVKAVDNLTNEVYASDKTTIKVKKYVANAVIETPASEVSGTTLSMAGWVMTTSPNNSLKVYLDGEEVSNYQVTRTSRNDVLDAVKDYGDKTTNPNPGYKTSFDVANYSDGKHTLELRVVDNNTSEVITTVKKTITLKKYDGILYLETPTRSLFNEGFTISGWAMSQLDGSYIKIYLNGQDMNLNVERSPRGDVISSIKGYGDETTNPTPGFSAYLDLTNIAPADYTLTVRLYSKLDEPLDEITKKIVVYDDVYFGIDVSYYQGLINWTSVKRDGIDFAMVRLGYRGYGSTGTLNLDNQYLNNVRGALQNNINLGIYFFSQAITEQEAIEEANYVLNNINLAAINNQITYPIVFDTEYTEAKPNGRADNLTKAERTKVAKAFLDTIKNAGYTPMIYASKSFLYDNLDMDALKEYDVWVAHYNKTTNPVLDGTDYTGAYHMWQYTSTGSIAGINGTVDLDISYKKY